MGFALVALPALREGVRTVVMRRFPPERCVIVGSGFVADLVARKIAGHPEYGVTLVGLVDTPSAGNSNGNGHGRFLGELERFEQICRESRAERILIAFSSLSHEELINVIRTSKKLDLKITVVPRLFEVIGHSVEVDQLEGMTLLGLRGFTRSRASLVLKRAIDFAGAAVGLIVLSPLLALIAVGIKLTSRGPVLFTQERIGRGTTPFRMVKFRTMTHGADRLKAELAHLNELDGPMFKIANDPRVTPLGRLLRRSSLDELPQLWNVLRGEMSLVGPRPLVPSEDDQVIGRHRERLDLTPGLTGPWQVEGRTATPFEEMVKLDYLYVAEWSLWNDLKLLIRTAPVVLRANGS
jgi:exopolysaccharide biosynthesis polyprenyl glycosylphosphotransferase